MISINAFLRSPQAVHVDWSELKLPWLDLDWFMDVSSQITLLDLSHNCLSSLPSVVPWGLIHLRSLNLSHNQLRELPTPTSSQEIICSRSETQLYLYNTFHNTFIFRAALVNVHVSTLNQENASRGHGQGHVYMADCIVIMQVINIMYISALLKVRTPVRIRTGREFNPDPPPLRISSALVSLRPLRGTQTHAGAWTSVYRLYFKTKHIATSDILDKT